MQACRRRDRNYYRCLARTRHAGSPALATHPPSVYLREDVVMTAVNRWLRTALGIVVQRRRTLQDDVTAEWDRSCAIAATAYREHRLRLTFDNVSGMLSAAALPVEAALRPDPADWIHGSLSTTRPPCVTRP